MLPLIAHSPHPPWLAKHRGKVKTPVGHYLSQALPANTARGGTNRSQAPDGMSSPWAPANNAQPEPKPEETETPFYKTTGPDSSKHQRLEDKETEELFQIKGDSRGVTAAYDSSCWFRGGKAIFGTSGKIWMIDINTIVFYPCSISRVRSLYCSYKDNVLVLGQYIL